MSMQYKLTIPFTLKHINKKYLTKEYGFVKICSCDINKPRLDEHLFLVYDLMLDNSKKLERADYLLNTLGLSQYTYKIKDKWYSIYPLYINNSKAKKFKRMGIPHLYNTEELKTLLEYWGINDTEIFKYVTDVTSFCKKWKEDYVDEADEIADDNTFQFIEIQKTPAVQ